MDVTWKMTDDALAPPPQQEARSKKRARQAFGDLNEAANVSQRCRVRASLRERS